MDRRKLSCAVGVLLVLLLLPSDLFSKEAPIKGLDRTRLIETAELKGLVNHPSVRIVDMRTSLPDYLKSHIPNAVFLHFETLRIPNNGIPAQAPDRITLERLLGENVSVSNNMWVVLYSENSNPNATYLAWTLDFLGHKKVGVLNGGWEKWVSENHPTTPGIPFTRSQEVLREAHWGSAGRQEVGPEPSLVEGRGHRRCPLTQTVQR